MSAEVPPEQLYTEGPAGARVSAHRVAPERDAVGRVPGAAASRCGHRADMRRVAAHVVSPGAGRPAGAACRSSLRSRLARPSRAACQRRARTGDRGAMHGAQARSARADCAVTSVRRTQRKPRRRHALEARRERSATRMVDRPSASASSSASVRCSPTKRKRRPNVPRDEARPSEQAPPPAPARAHAPRRAAPRRRSSCSRRKAAARARRAPQSAADGGRSAPPRRRSSAAHEAAAPKRGRKRNANAPQREARRAAGAAAAAARPRSR